MRITCLELKNFRSIVEAKIDLTTRTLVIGENGSGKSTLIDALAWGLLGRCRGVDGRGQGQKDLIRTGADRAAVRVTIDGVATIVREVTSSGSASNLKTDVILAKLGVTEPMVLAALYGRHFFEMHHADAKALLMRLLDVRVPPDKLPGLDVKEPVTLDELSGFYDAAFADRAALKKTLAAIRMPNDWAPNPAFEGLDVQVLQDKLAAQRKTYEAAVTADAAARAELTTATAALAAANQAASDVERLKGVLDAHVGMLKDQNDGLTQAKTALAAVEATQAEPVGELQAESKRLLTVIDRVEGAVGTPGQAERPCVLSDRIQCLNPAKEFKATVKQLKADVKALDARVLAGQKRAADLAAAQQQVRNAERQVSYHQDQVAKTQAAVAEATDAITRIADLARQVTQLQDQFSLASPVQDAKIEMDAQQKFLADLQAYRAQMHAAKQAKAQQADVAAKLERAEALVQLLGPKGIRATVLQTAVADFEAMINAALAAFGFKLAIEVDPWRIMVARGGGDAWVNFDMLSDGERNWTGLAFQLALAAMSGLDFCTLDAVETVVGQRRAILTQLVMKAPVGQVMVAMAKGDHEAPPELPGLQVIRMRQSG